MTEVVSEGAGLYVIDKKVGLCLAYQPALRRKLRVGDTVEVSCRCVWDRCVQGCFRRSKVYYMYNNVVFFVNFADQPHPLPVSALS